MKVILEKLISGEKLSRQETKNILLEITQNKYSNE